MVAAILKVGGGDDDDNDDSIQMMGVQGGHEEKDTRDVNSIRYLSDEDWKIVEIPESELMSGYNDNVHDTMQGFVSIIEAKKIPGYDPSR